MQYQEKLSSGFRAMADRPEAQWPTVRKRNDRPEAAARAMADRPEAQ